MKIKVIPQQGTRLEVKFIKRVGVKVWRKWRKLRNALVKEVGKCELCDDNKKLEGHHIYPRHLFPDLALKASNVIILCRDCHFRFGHFRNFHDYNPTINNLVQFYAVEKARTAMQREEI